MAGCLLRGLPRGAEIISRFATGDRFHDAEIRALDLSDRGGARRDLHAWTMTDEVGADGFHAPSVMPSSALTSSGSAGSTCDVSTAAWLCSPFST
ncbi:hypothetical protein [Jannaschia aquimarina]|uniref:Uncharacterized protein n=1 Tax=Jannaschia aquimarina TaxID=935700 RepID=A0A0D1CTE6_9RHOB|nr:hypothetical protein [Jannaschia aquimarina]KIT18042.1 hypothetical protein jaqu_01670 [Jannaschia aquimarina]SNS89118.1 hypothetical protein SAMN05421775_103192 [Jannaschia aquimarina]